MIFSLSVANLSNANSKAVEKHCTGSPSTMPENFGILGPGAGAVDIVLTFVETKGEGGVDRGDDLSVL